MGFKCCASRSRLSSSFRRSHSELTPVWLNALEVRMRKQDKKPNFINLVRHKNAEGYQDACATRTVSVPEGAEVEGLRVAEEEVSQRDPLVPQELLSHAPD